MFLIIGLVLLVKGFYDLYQTKNFDYYYDKREYGTKEFQKSVTKNWGYNGVILGSCLVIYQIIDFIF